MKGCMFVDREIALWLGTQGADDDTRIHVKHLRVEGDVSEIVDLFAAELKVKLREALEERNARMQESIRVSRITKDMVVLALDHVEKGEAD